MKNFIAGLFLFFVSVPVFSQVEFTKKFDEFTGNTTISTKPISLYKEILNRNGKLIRTEPKLSLSITIYDSQENEKPIWYLDASFRGDLGCLSKYSGKLMLLFDDGKTLELHQISDTDCSSSIPSARYLFLTKTLYESLEGNIELLYNEQEKYLDLFKEKSLKKIRIYGSKYYGDVEVNEELRYILVDKISTLEKNIN